jgi:hypothetical protein
LVAHVVSPQRWVPATISSSSRVDLLLGCRARAALKRGGGRISAPGLPNRHAFRDELVALVRVLTKRALSSAILASARAREMLVDEVPQRLLQMSGARHIAALLRSPDVIDQHMAHQQVAVRPAQQVAAQLQRDDVRHMFVLGDCADLLLAQLA